jgi:CDP-diacylglycerol--serine O-phosphatidyltransferase
MKLRFVGRLSLADVVTVSNAALGFLAAAVATVDVGVAARLILLAAVADGLDGVLARRYGSSPAGEYLDSLADVASFGVAPALVVAVRTREAWNWGLPTDGVGVVGIATAVDPVLLGAGLVPSALFVAAAVVRLGLYTALDSDTDETQGVQTTLAATILASATLAGIVTPILTAALAALLAIGMTLTVTYPDLHAQDALVMGVVQMCAICFTGWYGEAFAFAILFLALSYAALGPQLYWR